MAVKTFRRCKIHFLSLNFLGLAILAQFWTVKFRWLSLARARSVWFWPVQPKILAVLLLLGENLLWNCVLMVHRPFLGSFLQFAPKSWKVDVVLPMHPRVCKATLDQKQRKSESKLDLQLRLLGVDAALMRVKLVQTLAVATEFVVNLP